MMETMQEVMTLASQWRLLPEIPAFGITVGMVLGGLLASFLNVVVFRLPRMAHARAAQYIRAVQGYDDQKTPFNLSVPGSTCPTCGHAIRWYENIPVVSWLILRGRCSCCASPISSRYPLVEATGIVLGGSAVVVLGDGLHAVLALCIALSVFGVALIQYDGEKVPNGVWISAWLSTLAAAVIVDHAWIYMLSASIIMVIYTLCGRGCAKADTTLITAFHLSVLMLLCAGGNAAFSYLVLLAILVCTWTIVQRLWAHDRYISDMAMDRYHALLSAALWISVFGFTLGA
jgi:prepilin signal peptidase PulO-like enzyme (type II secretory pathway)